MNPAQEELISLIYAIVDRTFQGGITWSQATPTSFMSLRNTPSGPRRIIISRASRRGESDFLFQVKSPHREDLGEVAIDTSEKPYLRPILGALYQAAEESLDGQTARILRELLDE